MSASDTDTKFTLEDIIEALAFIKMTTRKKELIVLRCKHTPKNTAKGARDHEQGLQPNSK